MKHYTRYIDFDSVYRDLKECWSYKKNPNSIKEYNEEMYGIAMSKGIELLNRDNLELLKGYSRFDFDTKIVHLYFRDKENRKYWLRYNFYSELIESCFEC